MNYIALTIGPIYKTLQNAKKPKELFSSSYIFSYIMREIIKNFETRKFVTPYIEDETIFDENLKVGLFHDRFIFESKENDIYKLKSVIEDVLQDISQKLNISFEETQEYLQINYLEKELANGANPILELTPYLNTKELFVPTCKSDIFANSLQREKGEKDNFLTLNKDIEHDLKNLCYNNYYAIVHADGDKMGEAISKKENIRDVSKSLFIYTLKSTELITKYGGQTIYAGGDDLMFIAPTISKDRAKTIFDLCEDISQQFNIDKATLSFGISVNYHKFPLYEAVNNSANLLFLKAKNEKRNNIAFNITKHSGQSFETIIHKGDSAIYNTFLSFTSSVVNDDENIGNFLDSIHHKISSYETTIKEIQNNKDKLTNFFENYFNKDEHTKHQVFLKNLVEFLSIATVEQVYTSLRFIKFIKGDK